LNVIVPLFLGGLHILPVADQPPTLNVEASCRAVTQLNQRSGLADAQPLDGCLRDEEDARQTLRQSWATFSASQHEQCIGEATSGPPSYVDLLVCLQMQKDASALENTTLKGARKTKAR
jgi:hypothetical protein